MSETYKLSYAAEDIDARLGKVDDFSDFVTIQSFGAVGDGITDDTEALKNAAASGKGVFFPEGTYLLYEKIHQTKDINWYGEGKNSVIKLMPHDQSSSEEYEGRTVYNCAIITQSDGINARLSLKDLTLDANKDGYNNDILSNGSSKYDHVVCVDLFAPSGVYMRNVWILNGLIEGAYIYNNSDCDIFISDCHFNNNGYKQEDASGLHIEGTNYHTVINNCEFNNNGFHGLLVGGTCGIAANGITCSDNGYDGVMLWGGAKNNVINGAICCNNRGGLHIKGAYSSYYIDDSDRYAENNIISSLITKDNEYGVLFGNSKNTLINGWVSNCDNYSYLIGNDINITDNITGSVANSVLQSNNEENVFVATSNSNVFKVKTINGADQLYTPIEINYIYPVIEVGGISIEDGTNNDSTESIRTSEYIECLEGVSYSFTTNGYWWCLQFYDENYTRIESWGDSGLSYLYLCDSSSLAPSGAKYLRLHCEDTNDITNNVVISYK